MNADSLSGMDVAHVLWRDQDVLLLIAVVGSFNLYELFNEISCPSSNHPQHLRTIIFMLMRRLTASMKTSNSSDMREYIGLRDQAELSRLCLPRHRRGQPIASHNDCKRQIVENDFSPPLRDRASFSLDCVPAWSSVRTCGIRQFRRRRTTILVRTLSCNV